MNRLTLLLACLLFVVNAFAAAPPPQTAVVDISGTVMDETQAIIPGAKVRLLNAKGVEVRSTTSNDDGTFTLTQVPAGEYTMLVEYKGFISQQQQITVAQGEKINAAVEMRAAGAAEVVHVVAQATYSESQATTATRTDTPLRDIPQAIEVVNSELIRAQAATSVNDAIRNVAGVSIHMGEGRRDQVLIRGFSALSDQYVNGVRDDATYYRDLATLERIEVLKGPAAALYGRGSSGGIINRVLKRPESEQPLMAEFTTMFGSYGQTRLSTDVGAAFFGGDLSFRLPAAWEDSESHRDFFFLDRYTLAPSMLWKPGENTQVLAQFDFLDDHRLPDRGIPSFNGRPARVDDSTYYGFPDSDYLRNKVRAQSVNLEHRVAGWTLRNNFRYTHFDNAFFNTFSNGTEEVGGVIMVNRGHYRAYAEQNNYFNQSEAVKKASFWNMTHTFLGGIEYGRQDRDTLRFNGTAPAVTLHDPELTAPVVATTATTNNLFDGTVAGVYLQDQIDIAPKWKAMIGTRYDYYKQSLNDRNPTNVDLSRIDRQWSPRVGLVYQPTVWVSLYGNVSRSFQPSGEALSLAANNEELEPETTRNYEGGAKFELFGGDLSTTVSAFHLIRTNIKTTDPVDPTKLVLAGEQRTNGIEVSFNGRVTDGLDIYGGYAWLDTKVLESNSLSAGVPIEGNRAGLVPLHSFNLWGTYSFENGFGLGGGLVYNADRFVAFDNLVTLPGYTRLDATVFYKKRHYDLAVNVRNVGDIDYYETAHGNSQIYPGAPVNATVTTRVRW